LDATRSVGDALDAASLSKAMAGHILAHGMSIGTYER